MTINEETCIECDDLTGNAGKGEDSLYISPGGIDLGPYCQTCYDKWTRDMECPFCDDGEEYDREGLATHLLNGCIELDEARYRYIDNEKKMMKERKR